MSVSCVDHLGNRFPSKKALCRAYGVNYMVFINRIENGMDLKTALSKSRITKHGIIDDPELDPSKLPKEKAKEAAVKTGRKEHKGRECVDHLGNRFISITAMCKHHGVSLTSFRHRLKRGWSLEAALGGKKTVVQDHLGNWYPTMTAMAKAYGLTVSALYSRLKTGITLEDALTKSREELKPLKITDPFGKKWPSIKAMCEWYGVKLSTFKLDIKKGVSIAEALTRPRGRLGRPGHETVDHKGTTYESISEMCKAYGVAYGTYMNRIASGWNMEDALTKPIERKKV